VFDDYRGRIEASEAVMTDSPTQDGRVGALATPLGKDQLLLRRFDGNEGLGELFEYQVEAVSQQANIDFNQLLGLNLSVHLKTIDDVGRDFSGILVEARAVGKLGNLFYYRLLLKPWLWLLSHTSDCVIFSSMKVNDIIAKVFSDRGFTDYKDSTTEAYPILEYCVQYRETDMNFVCRLMEEYGIYYYFEHEKGSGGSPTKHTLVMVDSKGSHNSLPGLAPVPFLPTHGTERRDKQQFDDWSSYRGFQSGRFVLNDYDYEKPGANLVADAEQSGGYAHGSLEIYDYPGDYDDQGDGKKLAKVRLEADQANDHRYSAAGYAPSLTPGYKITRSSVEGSPDDQEYLVLRCTHSYGFQTYESMRDFAGGHEIYEGGFELATSDRQFRSPQVTRKSIIQGPQTAKVVGQSGEEIDVDEEGRVLLQFYWDRKKKSSRRVRVGQIWAGKFQRTIFIPRIGDEVVVHYLEGDPDRPMVVGAVYNGDNTVPIDLPADKTKSGMNTDSSKGHGGTNVLSFEDKAGEEYVQLRAQKDLMVRVLHNETRTVGGSQSESIGGDLTQSVGGNDTITVGGPKGGGQYSLTATQFIRLTVGGSSITISSEGIAIEAPMIAVTGKAGIDMTTLEMNIAATAKFGVVSPLSMVAPVLKCASIAWTAAVGAPPVPAPN
jgi:type VI secretion system secreted protein VgrG